jgi:hypothetical protein
MPASHAFVLDPGAAPPVQPERRKEDAMAAHPPPVPPAQRARPDLKETGRKAASQRPTDRARDVNTEEQGEAGNRAQNTTNKGLQQDR